MAPATFSRMSWAAPLMSRSRLNLQVSRPQIRIGETVEVTADVGNTGAFTADEVPQIYIHQQYGSASRPVRELKGFQRITLGPHEKKTVHFKLGIDELSYWSAAKKAWTEEPAAFDVWVGADSKASLHGSFRITQ